MWPQTIDTQQQQQQQQLSTMIPVRYRILLYLSILLVVTDLGINAFSEFLAPNRFGLLIIFIIQDVCIVLSVTLLIVMVLTTYLAQAGLLSRLLRMFRFPIIMACIYLAFCAVIQGLLLGERFGISTFNCSAFKKPQVLAFYVIQRTLSVFYYYGMKRGAYRLSDPNFYQSSKMLKNTWEEYRLKAAGAYRNRNQRAGSAPPTTSCVCCCIL